MEVKDVSSGKAFNRSIKATMNYLGTVGDHSPAHKNPKLEAYKLFKQRHLHWHLFAPYTKRDLMTFGNMPTKDAKTIEKFTDKIMNRHTRRHVKLHQFVLMPSDEDKIDPNDPDSVLRFKKYISNFVNLGINGKWYKYKGKYHYKLDKKNRFLWFADIQPDSRRHSRIHAHIVVINDNILTGNGMNPRTYHINHLRWAVNQVSKQLGFSKAPVKSKQHQPSKIEAKIIKASHGIRHNTGITSRAKLIKYLANKGVKAKYRKRKNKPQLNGWKFKIKGHAYIKASRLSRATGGDFLTSSNIATMLSDNRKDKHKEKADEAKKQAERQRAKHRKLVHQQHVFNQQNKRLAKQLLKAYKDFKDADSLYMGIGDTSGMQEWINNKAHLNGLENKALKEHRFSKVQLARIEHRKLPTKKPTVQHSKSDNKKQKSHVNNTKNNDVEKDNNKRIVKSINKPHENKQKVSSNSNNKVKQTSEDNTPVYSDSSPALDISKGSTSAINTAPRTVSDTMSYLSDNHARQDFGTELDMRNAVNVYNHKDTTPVASRLNRYDINDRTKFIRSRYNLSDDDGSTIDGYLNQSNKPHRLIHKIGRVLSKAKSWLKSKGIKFVSWLSLKPSPLIPPTGGGAGNDPDKDSDDTMAKRARKRNIEKNIHGDDGLYK